MGSDGQLRESKRRARPSQALIVRLVPSSVNDLKAIARGRTAYQKRLCEFARPVPRRGKRSNRGVLDLRLGAHVALAEGSRRTLSQGASEGKVPASIGLICNAPGSRNLERPT